MMNRPFHNYQSQEDTNLVMVLIILRSIQIVCTASNRNQIDIRHDISSLGQRFATSKD